MHAPPHLGARAAAACRPAAQQGDHLAHGDLGLPRAVALDGDARADIFALRETSSLVAPLVGKDAAIADEVAAQTQMLRHPLRQDVKRQARPR